MKRIQPLGPCVEVVEARSPDISESTIKPGVGQNGFQQVLHQKLLRQVAQSYGIQEGAASRVHAF